MKDGKILDNLGFCARIAFDIIEKRNARKVSVDDYHSARERLSPAESSLRFRYSSNFPLEQRC